MPALVFAVTLGLLGGVAVGLQGPLASIMSQRIGVWGSVLIIHLGGALLAVVLVLLLGGGNLAAARELPWYVLGAGALGVVVLSAVSYTIPRIGVTSTVTLIVAAELAVGAVLDHFGLLGAAVREIDLVRFIGLVVLFIGTWLIVR